MKSEGKKKKMKSENPFMVLAVLGTQYASRNISSNLINYKVVINYKF